MYYYKLYGLTVASGLIIPDAGGSELTQAPGSADVTVALSPVPKDFARDENTVSLTAEWFYSVPDPQLFYMHCRGFDFEISDGRTVKVDTNGLDINGTGLITYILGSAFGVVGIQRGFVPIHGAAVAVGDAAAIITGFSGSGKSAVLSALMREGYRYLADDVSMVETEGGVPFVFPSYPQRKIAAATARELGEDISGAEPINEDGRDKYAVRKASEWVDKKLPLACIVALTPVEDKGEGETAAEIRRVTGHASLGVVLNNQYRPQFIASIGTPPQRMKRLLDITSSVRIYRAIRPVTGFPVDKTAQMIAETCFKSV